MTTDKKPNTEAEEVNHPPHYNTGGLEVIDVLRAKLTPEEWKGYLKGNCLKYLLRADYKGGKVDIEKMSWYGKRLEACYDGKDDRMPTMPSDMVDDAWYFAEIPIDYEKKE